MDLESRLRRWVDADLITSEQADAIRALEAAPQPSRRITLASEALGYLGGALVVVAAVVAAVRFWDRLADWSKLGLVAMSCVLLLAGGQLARSAGDAPALRRLTSLLWFLASGAVGLFAAIAAIEILESDGEAVALLVGAAVTVMSAVLWGMRRTILQQAALAAGVVVTVVGALLLPTPDPGSYIGLAVWATGSIWVLLGWGGMIRPLPAAYAIGCAISLGGAQAFALSDTRGPGLVLGVAYAAVLIVLSVTAGVWLFLAFSAVGVFMFVPQLVFEYFGETLGAPLALFIGGVVVLGTGVLVARLRPVVARAAADAPDEDASGGGPGEAPPGAGRRKPSEPGSPSP